MANTQVYREEWEETLQEELDKPVFWQDVCRVDFTSSKVIHNPYQNNASEVSYTRGNTYSFQDWTMTDETVDINNTDVIPEFIDRADLAQIGFDMQMERAERQGVRAKEIVEEEFLGDYSNMTTFDESEIGGSGSIALTDTNVDDVVRAIKKKIYNNNGQSMFSRNGGFVIWDPEAYEKLEAFAMANGTVVQDNTLQGGANGVDGFNLLGMTHYASNSLTTASNTLHVVAGVKKAYHLGILNTTWGDLVMDEKDPNLQSGISLVTRVDRKGKVWNNMSSILFDVQIDRS